METMIDWYASDQRIKTKTASHQAIQIADWIQTGDGLDEGPDEHTLFCAFHTCAYRATRPARRKKITACEREEWVRRWQIIREYIVESNLGLVYNMIGRFGSQKNVDEDDMLSDAMYGLSRAVDRYNPWRGYKFSTYACNVIARSLMRTGKRENRYRRLFPVHHDVSMEQPDHMSDTQRDLYVERLNRALDANLGQLTDIESRIIAKRFPSDNRSKMTFSAIGKSVGLSKERVRQIQNHALDKLRGVLERDPVLQ